MHGLGPFKSVHSVRRRSGRLTQTRSVFSCIPSCLSRWPFIRPGILSFSISHLKRHFGNRHLFNRSMHRILALPVVPRILVGVRFLVHKPTPTYIRILVFRLVAAAFSGPPPRLSLTGSKNVGVSQWALLLWGLHWGEPFCQLPRGILFHE